MAPVEFVVPAGRPLESLGMTVCVVALLFLASGAVVESAVFADVTARVGLSHHRQHRATGLVAPNCLFDEPFSEFGADAVLRELGNLADDANDEDSSDSRMPCVTTSCDSSQHAISVASVCLSVSPEGRRRC